jgi:hypothetical protein
LRIDEYQGDRKFEQPPPVHPAADPYPKTQFEPLRQLVDVSLSEGGCVVSIAYDIRGRELADVESFKREANHWAAFMGKALNQCCKMPRRSAEAELERGPGSV